MSDLKYAIDKESDDTQHLIHFNDHVHFFTELTSTPHWCRYDYDAIDRYNRKVIIEHKSRSPYYNLDYFQQHPIYIETEKYHYLKNAANEQNAIPLYINYLKDDTVVIHPLNHFTEEPQKETPVIQNMAKQNIERVDRYLLPLDKAIIYQYDGYQYKEQQC